MNHEIDDELQFEEDVAVSEVEELAKSYIRLFFKNRLDRNGEEIEVEELFTNRNISLVLNQTVCEGLLPIYSALTPRFRKENAKRRGKVSADVECVLKLLNDCSKLGIPKCCATGLLVMYVEVCEGCKVDIERG